MKPKWLHGAASHVVLNDPPPKETAIAIQDFDYHPPTSTNTARDFKFTANRCLSSKRNAEN